MEKISRRRFLKGTVAVGAGALLSLYSDGSYKLALAQESPAFRMRILHTNDHHARIEPVLDGDTPLHGGVSRRKTLIDQVRGSESLPLLLVDAGDVFQGTLYFNLFSGMADLEFYNAMGYEVMAIGNHEFDKTQADLATFIRGANFPVLSANIQVDASSPLAGLIKPSTIIEKGGKRIGIFSVSPEDTGELALGALPGTGVTFTSAIEAARAQVAALQAAGADYVIGLTHVGITVDREIARQVSGISLIIGGHSHTPMGPMNEVGDPPYPELIEAPDGKPVVLVHDWEWGRWLGDLTVAWGSDGRVVDVQGNPTEVLPSVTPDPGFEARISVFASEVDAFTERVIGSTTVELNGNRNDIRSKETNLGNLVAEAMLAKASTNNAQLAITNGGGIRASIPVGDITVGQVLEVLPFGNTLAVATITGAQVKEALENGVSQIESGAGRFPQIAGFSFTYDPSLPVGSRVTSITYNSAALDPAASYRVATNNFMLVGGDGYTAFTQGSNSFDTGFILADLVEQYITANSPLNIGTDGRISVGAGSGAPAPAPAPEPAPGEPAPSEPVPVPVTLPNTGGALAPLGWLASLGASALAGGMALRRRARAAEQAEPAEEVAEMAEVE